MEKPLRPKLRYLREGDISAITLSGEEIEERDKYYKSKWYRRIYYELHLLFYPIAPCLWQRKIADRKK